MNGDTYRQKYMEQKESVLSFLDSAIQYLSDRNNPQVESLMKLRSSVEKGLFSIVLVGEFSAGKSMLLNALMHKKILASFQDEATSTINFLRGIDQAPKPGVVGEICYLDGTVKELTELNPDIIEQYTTTRGNRNGQKLSSLVDHVDLYLDSEILKNGVMLVDCPGLNSLDDHHAEITEKQILASHAGIFMFRAEQPGSRTDFEFLSNLKKQTNNIFLVLNKIDLILESEGNSVEDTIEHLRHTYHQQFQNESGLPKIWPIAAKAALAARDADQTEYNHEPVNSAERRQELEEMSRLSALEDRLWKFLTQGERTKEQLRQPISVAMDSLMSEYKKLNDELVILESKDQIDILIKRREVLEQKIADQKRSRRSIGSDIKKEIDHQISDLIDMIETKWENIYAKVVSDMNTCNSLEELQECADTQSHVINRKLKRLAETADKVISHKIINLIEEHDLEFWDDIQNRFDEINLNYCGSLSLPELTKSDPGLHFGLEEVQKKMNHLREEIQKAEEQTQLCHENLIKARNIERTRKELQSELDQLEKNRQFIELNTSIPEIVHYQQSQDQTVNRGGLLGKIADFLVGEKHIQVVVDYEDTSSRDDALNQKAQQLNRIEQQRKELVSELENHTRCPDEVTCELREFQFEMAQQKQKKTEQKWMETNEAFKADISQKVCQACRQYRRDVEDQFCERFEEYLTIIKKDLHENKNKYIRSAQDILNLRIDAELEAMTADLDRLMQTINADEAERSQKKLDAEAARDRNNHLRNQGKTLLIELDQLPADHLEEVAF